MYGIKRNNSGRLSLFGSTAGFTLVEVVTIMVIMVAVIGLANWSAASYAPDMRLRGATSDVDQSIKSAKFVLNCAIRSESNSDEPDIGSGFLDAPPLSHNTNQNDDEENSPRNRVSRA